MARLAREDNEALKARIAALEAKVAEKAEKPSKKVVTPPPAE
jgi:BMFP domain-containing protein YqiC